jgi:hypothetical protein
MALRQRGTEQDVVLDRDCIGLDRNSRLSVSTNGPALLALTVTHKDVGLIPVLARRAAPSFLTSKSPSNSLGVPRCATS